MSKYIRTKDGIIAFGNQYPINTRKVGKQELWGFRELTEENFEQMKEYNHWKIIKQSDTIEKLCDEFVVVVDDYPTVVKENEKVKNWKQKYPSAVIYGAVWCEWGLKYVAKLDDKGELHLL